ncbi:M3 family oligoendopeptidase [uncultured Dubosiella sp.]|uniref:M3 family oligoendopeptidase n=1 Tax=uncultured Dubosiella sp. TaxID=1937011 RepID=UPI00272F0F4D|nr:M3 family oligoendopeptidase [uncultured Dubosiella sp.]
MDQYLWNLNDLYEGYEDQYFLNDVEFLNNLLLDMPCFTKALSSMQAEEIVVEGLKRLEQIKDYSYRLQMYTQLMLSVDANNSRNNKWANNILGICSSFGIYESQIWDAILHVASLKTIIEKNDFVRQYEFILLERLEKQSYELDAKQEEILAMVYPTSLKAFSDLYYALTGNAKAEYNGILLPLTQVKNMCHDNSSKVRKDAFIAEQNAYKTIEVPLAFAIFSIKQQQLNEAKLRGYKDPLEKMLIDSRMSKKTLDVMMNSIESYLPVFRNYLRTKAKLLGYQNGLPWYEIYATLGECDFNFTIEDCEKILLEHFKPVSENLYNMTKRAIDNQWIDYPTREGKQPGAFCENLGWIKQSRIITNYNNTLSDVITVAHELGHAFHGMMIEDQPVLNRDYCMPLAETASTFNENLIYNALQKSMSPREQMLVLDSQLSALCQNILDIYARFQFETMVFQEVENGFLNADQLCELMKKALIKSFGDGLDPEWLHPYRWITKVHYYIPNIAYYNFPYTFGALFSRGLYALYAKEGQSFIPKYEKLLAATTTNTCEDVAKIADIDLTDEQFWMQSLQSIVNQMNKFLKLAKGEQEHEIC